MFTPIAAQPNVNDFWNYLSHITQAPLPWMNPYQQGDEGQSTGRNSGAGQMVNPMGDNQMEHQQDTPQGPDQNQDLYSGYLPNPMYPPIGGQNDIQNVNPNEQYLSNPEDSLNTQQFSKLFQDHMDQIHGAVNGGPWQDPGMWYNSNSEQQPGRDVSYRDESSPS